MELEGLRAQLEGRHHRVVRYHDTGDQYTGTRTYWTACELESSYMFGDRKPNHILEGAPPPHNACETCFPEMEAMIPTEFPVSLTARFWENLHGESGS